MENPCNWRVCKFSMPNLIAKFNLFYDYYPFKVPRQGRFCSVLVTNLTNCQWTTVGQDLGSRKIKPAVRRKTEQIGMFLLLGEPGSDHQIPISTSWGLSMSKVFCWYLNLQCLAYLSIQLHKSLLKCLVLQHSAASSKHLRHFVQSFVQSLNWVERKGFYIAGFFRITCKFHIGVYN